MILKKMELTNVQLKSTKIKSYVSEFLGIFGIVFIGTGSIILNIETHGSIGHFWISAIFGITVTCMILLFRQSSEAHFNPAVSFALVIKGDFSIKKFIPYIIFQFLGGISASLMLKIIFPLSLNLGATIPAGSNLQSFLIEFFLMFILMFAILILSSMTYISIFKKNIIRIAGPVFIGLIVFGGAYLAGPFSGASINPARSLGPAIASLELRQIWIYLIAPFLGGIFAVWSWQFLKFFISKLF